MTETRSLPLWRRWAWALPLLIFAGLAGLFWLALGSGDPHRLPSAMLGKQVPHFSLPQLQGLQGIPGLSSADLATGQPTIVNVWASWCIPCREENAMLLQLAKQPGVRLYGINYKDDPDAARRFLGRFGNPFSRLGTDQSGRVAIDWGVYGVPETYVVDGNGKITYRHIGPLTAGMIENELLPRLQAPKPKLTGAAKAG